MGRKQSIEYFPHQSRAILTRSLFEARFLVNKWGSVLWEPAVPQKCSWLTSAWLWACIVRTGSYSTHYLSKAHAVAPRAIIFRSALSKTGNLERPRWIDTNTWFHALIRKSSLSYLLDPSHSALQCRGEAQPAHMSSVPFRVASGNKDSLGPLPHQVQVSKKGGRYIAAYLTVPGHLTRQPMGHGRHRAFYAHLCIKWTGEMCFVSFSHDFAMKRKLPATFQLLSGKLLLCTWEVTVTFGLLGVFLS